MNKNYYHILGIPSTATAAEIKAAYKRLALKYHPDRNPDNARAEEQFKLVNEAYQVLSNPRQRAGFDLKQQYEQQQRQAQAYSVPRYHHTREPAGFRERHYRQRPQRHSHFSKRDVQIVVAVVVLAILLVLGLKLGWDSLAVSRAQKQAHQALAQQQWPAAEEAFSTVLDHVPDQEEARLQRAQLRYQHLKDPQGAAQDYSSLIWGAETPKAQWYAARGACFLQLKQFKDALQDFDQALQQDSSLLHVYHDRAIARLQLQEDWAAAVQDLTHFLQSTSVKPAARTEALLHRAYAFYRLERWGQAMQDTEQALAQDSQNAKGFYLQALVARAQNGTSLSCELLKKAAQLGFPPAREEAARYCPA